MAIDLYAMDLSPSCRAVMLLMAALNLTSNFKEVNLLTGDHKKPAFLKLSPHHSIPTLIDNGFTLTESRTIMSYLTQKYGKDSGLIPKDVEGRAVMNQMLEFELGTIHHKFMEKYIYVLQYKVPTPAYAETEMENALLTLDLFLEGRDWVAGKKMTVADFSYASIISTLVGVGRNITSHKNINNWYTKAKNTMKGWDANEAGANKAGTLIQALYKKSLTST